MSELYNALPPKARKTIYIAFALAGLVIGGVHVGFSSAGASPPVLLDVALAVYAFVGSALGLTAFSNTPKAAQIGIDLQELDNAEYIEDAPGTPEATPAASKYAPRGLQETIDRIINPQDEPDGDVVAPDQPFSATEPDDAIDVEPGIYTAQHSGPVVPEVEELQVEFVNPDPRP